MKTKPDRKTELQLIAAKALAEYREITDAEDQARNAGLIGKTFRYRNSYSCPGEGSDYWYLYKIVKDASGSNLICSWFQKDASGRIEMDFDVLSPTLYSGDEEIPPAMFWDEWRKLQSEIAGIKE